MAQNFGGLGFTVTIQEKKAAESFEHLAENVDKFTGSLEAIDFDSLMNEAAPVSKELEDALSMSPEKLQAMMGLDTPAEQLFRKMKANFGWFKKNAGSSFSAAGKEVSKYVGPVIAGFGHVKGAMVVAGKIMGSLGSAVKTTVGFFSGLFKSAGSGVSKLTKGFGDLAGVISRMDKMVGLQRIQTFVQGAILGKLNEFAGKVAQIAEVNNLTTGWEAHWQQLGVQARKTGANFGVTGKELDKFTGKVSGMMHGMQISSDAAGQAVKGFKVAQKELAAVGITNAEDLAKLADVTGVSADVFQETLRKASKEFGFADKELQQFTGSFLDAGKAIGDVPKMMGQLPKMTEMLTRLKSAGINSASALADYAKQTAALTKGFYASGKSAEMSTQLAMTLTEKLVESRENIRNMFAGTESDLNSFSLELGISVGDISEAFKLMQSGPQGMMTGLAKMAISAKKNGKDVGSALSFMSARLEQAVGKEAAAELTNFIGNANESVLEQMAATDKATDSLGKFAKEGWRSSKTLQDGWDDAKNNFISNFRAIGKDGAVRFVKESQEAFGDFNKTMAEVAKKGGPLGSIVEKMAEMHHIGAMALIPKTLRPMVTVFGTLGGELLPVAAQLGALGFRFSMLVSPIALIGLAIGGLLIWFASLRMSGKTTEEAFTEMQTKIEAFLVKLPGMLEKGWDAAKKAFESLWKALGPIVMRGLWELSKIDLGAVLDKIIDKALPIIGQLVRGINKYAPQVLEAFFKLIPTAGKLIGKVGDLLVKIFTNIDWARLAQEGAKGAGTLIDGLVPAAAKLAEWGKKILDSIGNALTSIDWAKLGDKAGGAISGMLDKLAPLATDLLKWAVALGQSMLEALTAAIKAIDWNKLLDNIFKFLGELPGQFEEALPAILELLDTLWGKALDIVAQLPARLSKLLDDALPIIKRVFPKIVKWLVGAVWSLIKKLPEFWMGGWKLLKSVIDLIVTLVIGLFEGIIDWFKETFPKITKIVGIVFDTLTAIVRTWWEAVKATFQALWDFIVMVWDGVGAAFTWVWDEVLKPLWDTLAEVADLVWTGIKDAAGAAWDGIVLVWDTVSGWFSKLWDAVKDAVGKAWDWVKDKIIGVWDAVKKVWDGVTGYFSGLFGDVKKAIFGDMDKLEEKFKGLTDKLKHPFDTLMSVVRKNHENSVNTIVGDDMDKTVKAVTDSAKDITKVLDNVLHDAVSKSVFRAFNTAFKAIVENTKTFFVVEELKHFVNLKTEIIKVWASMAISLLEITAAMTKAMGTDLANIVDDINKANARVTSMEASRAAAKSTAVDEEIKTQLAEKYAGKGFDVYQTALIDATNNPIWFTHYQQMFRAEMNALKAAVQASPIGAKGNGGAPGAASDKEKSNLQLTYSPKGTSK